MFERKYTENFFILIKQYIQIEEKKIIFKQIN